MTQLTTDSSTLLKRYCPPSPPHHWLAFAGRLPWRYLSPGTVSSCPARCRGLGGGGRGAKGHALELKKYEVPLLKDGNHCTKSKHTRKHSDLGNFSSGIVLRSPVIHVGPYLQPAAAEAAAAGRNHHEKPLTHSTTINKQEGD